ncbi:hypothetical protein CLOBY_17870 [Clostridium saccharobutylicum]|uniref:hypothetical protein n=1 Tax=Clostridium saccharobutylicum TaxID=169679 RepID=UPI000983ECEC|nr:hypothetical protein [Clostridium saccharobutylicum]AQS09656.1 hypothetical protein CLOBY_17870 [Clostridium saccharobutylicum]MBC2438818.1 hypothetical protein [Clostridium saccharobutylicum]NSB91089.1 hypothetical protein [Clostridium saccharobutylicum]NYC27955.1 hypothetical protein [Clostridium saccharobutylicum]OOM12965.1 hypothetical protein CLSAB_36560 [Clostridium saccharobutylicum]
MAKIIFLFKKLKITNTNLEDLELTENFLNNKNVQDLGYDPEELAEAYRQASKDYKW